MSMEQRVLIRSLREKSHESTQIHSQVVENYKDKALSYPDVSYWVQQFHKGRESVSDPRRSGKPPDFQTHFRIEGALEASPNASVRHIPLSTVSYVFTQVLHLEFRNGTWVPHKLSGGQKRTRAQLAVSLQTELERVQRRKWTEFYTGDESEVVWKNCAKGCSLSLDEEIPERTRQTIGAEKGLFTFFQSEWFRYCRSSATKASFPCTILP
jgi:hypothetical protein